MRSQVTPAHHRAAMCGTDQGIGHTSGTPMQALDPWKCRGAAPSCGAGRGARGAGISMGPSRAVGPSWPQAAAHQHRDWCPSSRPQKLKYLNSEEQGEHPALR